MKSGQIAGTTIVVAGFVMTVVGIVVAAAFDPIVGIALFAVGISDIVVGSMFRSGRLGSQRSPEEAEQAESDAHAEAEVNAAALGTTADGEPISGDANPYARED